LEKKSPFPLKLKKIFLILSVGKPLLFFAFFCIKIKKRLDKAFSLANIVNNIVNKIVVYMEILWQ